MTLEKPCDPVTGKTLAPGICIIITNIVQVLDSVPYMDMDTASDRLQLKFSDDLSYCR